MDDRYSEMTDQELLELSRQRVKKTGNFKQTAIRAQRELWERHHWTNNERTHDDGVFCRGTEDIDYNG